MKILSTALLCLASTVHAADLPKGILALDGRPAPELRLADLDGERFDLRDHRGRWAFVHFWASWCGPCRREMPTIQRMTEHLVETPLEIVLVNTAETEDAVFSFLSIVAPDLSSLMDPDGLVTERWQPRGLPSTFLVDPAGRVRFLAIGDREWDTPTYLDWLRRLTESPESNLGVQSLTKLSSLPHRHQVAIVPWRTSRLSGVSLSRSTSRSTET